jgi:hypothetical protein
LQFCYYFFNQSASLDSADDLFKDYGFFGQVASKPSTIGKAGDLQGSEPLKVNGVQIGVY